MNRASSSPEQSQSGEEPRKKGSRGGKRSVTNLTKAQLARKRANDREAQRNIRQRTKEHIETLEKRVRELEESHGGDVEQIKKRNRELESEIEALRSKLTASSRPHEMPPPELPTDLFSQDAPSIWMPEQDTNSWSVPIRSQMETAHYPATTAYPSTTAMYQSMAPSMSFGEDAAHLLTPLAVPTWEDTMMFGEQSNAIWAPFHPKLSEPSRFAELDSTQVSDFMNSASQHPSYNPSTTCWQVQPSIHAWQISTKLKAPISHVDQLMLSVIQTQRHLSITGNMTGEPLIGPSFPSVNVLFNQPAPLKPPSSLTEVMERYANVLTQRGFQLIPEKLASFMCMYRFVQWQISPTYATYQLLHEWQAPRPSQLLTPHPAWMDLPPWGKFREMIIENQAKYDNVEFQNDYACNLSVNFPYDPMKALVFNEATGEVKISGLLDRWLGNIGNMSMKRPFALKYPEFEAVCRFDLE